MDLHKFIESFDQIFTGLIARETTPGRTFADFVDFYKDQFGSAFVNFIELEGIANLTDPVPPLSFSPPLIDENMVNLMSLCSLVGLPSFANDMVTMSSMRNQWMIDGWVDQNFVVETESTSSATKFLFKYVFDVWKKLHQRIVLEKTDTTFGFTNRHSYRWAQMDINGIFKRKFSPTNSFMSPGISKFPCAEYHNEYLVDFGKYFHPIKNTNPEIAFGNLFYNSSGYPQKKLTGNTLLNEIVRPSDNIIFLSRVKMSDFYGVNVTYKFGSHSAHRSMASAEKKKDLYFTCNIIAAAGDKPTTYKQIDINTKKLNNEVRNTIIHEFSHNYLRDEYSRIDADIKGALDLPDISSALKYSNLQTIDTLAQGSHDIHGDKIKWKWPRVKKIGMAIEAIGAPQNSVYECKVKTNAKDSKGTKHLFEAGDKVLLRKRFLFEPDFVTGTIESIIDDSDPSIQTLNINFTTINNPSDYQSDYIVIFPFWRDQNQTEYQQLVHHAIDNAITNTNLIIGGPQTGRALVHTVEIPDNFQQQQIDTEFNNQGNNENIIKKINKNTSLIVGLYAGGNNSYNQGIYHSSGFCLMRGSKTNVANSFCPVCSYMIIDYLDPMQHPFMKRHYGKYRNI